MVEEVTLTEGALAEGEVTISRPPCALTLPTPVLNAHPFGAVRINVFAAPPVSAKSLFAPSVMTMLPRVVYAGDVAFAALSAEMFVPPEAAVTLTVAATYGPTNGPPLPTGAAPAGLTDVVSVSAIARARLIRPLPVCSCVP